MVKKEPTIDYTHNPFTDMLGNPVMEGECVASPEIMHKTLVHLNISICEGYDERGIILKMLNRRTGRWRRFFPRHNKNVVRIKLGENTIEDLSEVYPWVKEIRDRGEIQQGPPRHILKDKK